MLQVLISILALIIALGVLITVHEFGHFWVARRFGIKVLRFSIGFGKPFYRWHDKLGTEYVLASIPLGGYVSLFGEKQDDSIPINEKSMTFSEKPVWVRLLVLLAGPGFNFIFAIVAYWLLFVIGVTVMVPLLGEVPKDTIAGKAGLQKGQEIIAIDNRPTPSWEDVGVALVSHLGEENTIIVTAKDAVHENLNTKEQTVIEENGDKITQAKEVTTEAENIPTKNYYLDLSQWESSSYRPDLLQDLGLIPFHPPIIYGIYSNQPAESAGLNVGDTIISVDNQKIETPTEAIQYIQQHPNIPVHIEVLRDHQQLSFNLTPLERKNEAGKPIGYIGIKFPPIPLRVQQYSIWQGFKLAISRTYEYSVATLDVMKKMIMGKISSRYISGPIGIAKLAGIKVKFGFEQFLGFLAMISISLGVLNLMPIPVLDGGHILFCLIEIVMGRKVPPQVQSFGMWIGGAILLAVMVLAIFNDIRAL